MAVYTEVTDEALQAFLKGYDLGRVLSFKGIAEGVENSNYLLRAESGPYILTLYEKRVNEADLPFFLGLMEHLATHGVVCPQPVRSRSGAALGRLSERAATIVTFLEGLWLRRPRAVHCGQLGEALARMHEAGRGFTLRRENALSLAGWPPLFEAAKARADEVAPHLREETAAELAFLQANWPKGLPDGVIHADLFTDNVFFLEDRLSGLIDFYFACNDFLAYDLAICLNAWCFEPDGDFNVSKGMAMIGGYQRVRPLERSEVEALPILARGSALRFMLTRLVDWLNVPPGALVKPKDPLEYLKKLRFHQAVVSAADYGLKRVTDKVEIWTDGGCKGNPGPGGWGAILKYGDKIKELKGGEPETTNNRMELTAAISALEALRRPCAVELHTDSQYVRQGVTSWIQNWKRNGWRTADKKPVKNEDLWRRLDEARAHHKIDWRWVKGHAGNALNERADVLAGEGMKPYL